MKRAILLLGCLALSAGCSGSATPNGATFKSEAEELEYLSSLSQPSVEQFRRRKVLAERESNRKAFEWAGEGGRRAEAEEAYQAKRAAKASAAK